MLLQAFIRLSVFRRGFGLVWGVGVTVQIAVRFVLIGFQRYALGGFKNDVERYLPGSSMVNEGVKH